jgi:hypothetical protein
MHKGGKEKGFMWRKAYGEIVSKKCKSKKYHA